MPPALTPGPLGPRGHSEPKSAPGPCLWLEQISAGAHLQARGGGTVRAYCSPHTVEGGGGGEERRGWTLGWVPPAPPLPAVPGKLRPSPPRKVRARPALRPDLSSHFLELSEPQFQLYLRCLPDSEVPGPLLCPQKEVQIAQNKCPLSSPCCRPAGLGDHCLGPSWRSGVRSPGTHPLCSGVLQTPLVSAGSAGFPLWVNQGVLSPTLAGGCRVGDGVQEPPRSQPLPGPPVHPTPRRSWAHLTPEPWDSGGCSSRRTTRSGQRPRWTRPAWPARPTWRCHVTGPPGPRAPQG